MCPTNVEELCNERGDDNSQWTSEDKGKSESESGDRLFRRIVSFGGESIGHFKVFFNCSVLFCERQAMFTKQTNKHVRCSVTFTRIDDLLSVFQHIQSHINSDKNRKGGGMKGIVRIKNGFIQTELENPKYSDIKLNVLFEDKEKLIVAEIQLMLQIFLENKKRTVESIQQSNNPQSH